ncbi:MAG TPA: hypothetical protein VGK29_04050 [Paludibaculum sp.]|jgi:hypothetical protein
MNRAALITCLFFCLLPVLAPPDFPTQDGPSHLYNTAILRDYASVPLYQLYYERRLTLAGNVLTQPLLLLLMSVMPPEAASRTISAIVVAAFPLALAWLLSAYTRNSAPFLLFGSICALNFFVQMGFWNFCFGVVLLLFALGWAARGRAPWGIAAFSLALYLSHPLAWAVFGLYCGIRALESRRFLPLLAHAPGALLVVIYMTAASGPPKPVDPSWGGRLWPFYSLSFLHTRTNFAETIWALCVLAVFAALLAATRRRPDALVWTAAGCVAVGLLIQQRMSWDAYFTSRMALFAFLLLLAWCAARQWPPAAQRALSALALVLLISGSLIRLQLCRQWSAELASYTQVFSAIQPGSTVLAVRLEEVKRHFSPTAHALGLLAPMPFVDLRNYEAASDHFLTRFRSGRSPFPALGNQMELERPMPRMDIGRYERETGGRVDYLLFEGPEATETRIYASELSRFRLVRSRPGARLYFSAGVHPSGAVN